jgi:23S rRNA-/tRNA-specific pseudouridylate synthase
LSADTVDRSLIVTNRDNNRTNSILMISLNLPRIDASFFSQRWCWELTTSDISSNTPILPELTKRLPHIDPKSWPERFLIGGAYIAGIPAKINDTLTAPCRLEYYEPRISIDKLESFYPKFSDKWIIYKDSDIGVVYKPPRLPTTPARDQQRYNLQDYLANYLNQPVHLTSRLDAGVQGVLIFSLSQRMNRHLQKAYNAKRIRKYYLACVSGEPPLHGVVIDRAIQRDPRHPALRMASDSERGAITKITVLRRIGDTSRYLIGAEPITGRTHQIRVHCSYSGYPIVGDPFYGGEEAEVLHLLSHRVGFYHPYLNRDMEFEGRSDLLPEHLTKQPLCV